MLLIVLLLFPVCSVGEYVREFQVSESVSIGTTIGKIGSPNPGQPSPPQPPYTIVGLSDSQVDSDLLIEESTGEIKTKRELDHEMKPTYSFIAFPQQGENIENIRVLIKVKDENDNAPTFPTSVMNIAFPENTARDVKRPLEAAIDKDSGIYNTQRYAIVSGNTNSEFRLSSQRLPNGVLFLDLQINGFLDRETKEYYSLLIEAWDGGTPPLKGSMIVNITIQDINDNQPTFIQSRYFATVPENATIGTSVLEVLATDTDAGENGRITYSINRRLSDRDNMFQVNPKTGVISVNRPLDFETKEVHELVVEARDNGETPKRKSAFVSIRVIDVNDNQPTINLIFLSDDATPKISEDAQPGEFVARISVNDPDSKEEYPNVNVTLEGGEGHFGLTTHDNIIYLMIVSRPLDRELKPNYSLMVIATDQGNPPLHASRQFDLQVTDLNDNAPEFDQTVYSAYVLEVADPGTSVFQLSASDRDEGNNSLITYSIKNTPETHSDWFQIDSRTGLITTRTHVDCETEPVPQITVIATDSGSPAQSSSATVKVTIRDVNDNEPIFDQSFYNVSVQESEPVGNCILKVSAEDPDCGVNAIVNYTIGESFRKYREFEIRPVSGDICISGRLDHETRSVYEFPVVATDRGGLSTTAMVKVQLTDVNDNKPTFYPRQYNVSLRENHVSSFPVVVVVATDNDSGIYGQVTYELVGGNETELFRLDSKTGGIFVTRPLSKTSAMYHINVSAKDGAGVRSEHNAEVAISVIDTNQEPPIFEKPRYTFNAREDVRIGHIIGTVSATSSARGGGGRVRYTIYSGDPSGYFSIDHSTGVLKTASPLDHELQSSVLLNVLATTGTPPTYGHTQVNISIWDVNDNAPEFDVPSVKISVPENTALQEAIYAAHATDQDSGDNGVVTYSLLENPANIFTIDKFGILMLKERLDYEAVQRYTLVIGAKDEGHPPLSSNLTVNMEVQDVNDNPPVFYRESYSISIIESLPANSQFFQVTATDEDTGNNARLTYTIREKEFENIFGVFPNSGSLYLKEVLDRETRDHYVVTVVATDNGTPVTTASTTVYITVLDANDNTPTFSKQVYEFTIEENLDKGTFVGSVFAEDNDLGNNASLRYTLEPSHSKFRINPRTGNITTVESLDREEKAVYEVIVEVKDEGVPPRYSKATVRVLVTDVNDNTPTFVEPREASVSVREDQPAGTEVLQVRATDKDEGNNASITYSFLPTDDSDDHLAFIINPSTGVISTAKVLDHELKSRYSLVVVASDQGEHPKNFTKLIQIEVLDVNDNRTYSPSALTFSVKEGSSPGEKVGTSLSMVKTSSRQGDVSYSISDGNTDSAFDINKKSGQLFTVKPIDFETVPEYHLKIEAIDSGAMNPQESILNVKVEVEDANDEIPIFAEDPIMFSISESLAIGSVVWNFTATDKDAGDNGRIGYSLTQQSPKKVFKLDSVTGVLTLMGPLDYEEQREFTLVVTASDQPRNEEYRLHSSVTAKILIQDFNDNAPKFVSSNRIDIMEDEPIGFSMLHVIAVDEDSGDNGKVTYIISSGNDEGRFALDYETGVLSIVKSLDRERTTVYHLNITASDHGVPQRSVSQVIEINVEDVNDNAPEFSLKIYRAQVSEGSVPGTFVTRVSASDRDFGSNSNLTYIIPAGIGDNKFRINPGTGEIHTVATLDREEKEQYALTVYVRDGSFPAQYDTASVLVSLSDVNDHAPEFRDSCYPLRVPENTDLSVIHTVLATDKDSGINSDVNYSLSGEDFGNKFSIDTYSGQLSSRPLDREDKSKYSLYITARDRGKPSQVGSCNITITVEDQNDNDPKFSKTRYTASILENTPPGTSVLRVEATDKDHGENARITYSLSNETQWLFKIDNETGVISTAGVLDREKQDYFSFEVRATDGGQYDSRSETAHVEISIGDVNDNRPAFVMYPFVVNVSVYSHPGQQLVQVKAIDPDEGINSDIVYSLSQSSQSKMFRINSDTGVVTTTSALSLDNGKLFHIEVIARDKGSPSLTSTGLVEIQVGEPSATTLKFQNSSYEVHIPENSAAGTDVVQVTALRSDDLRERITYTFGSGNEDNLFEINSNNGLIRVRDSDQFDYELIKKVDLVIVAQASGETPLYAYANVRVNIVDMNDNSPRFTQDQYVSSVWEGNNKGTYVIQVSATDDDTGPNANIVYYIVDGNRDDAFVIDPPFSGIVKTNIVLDREIRETYRLTIIATDEGAPEMTGTCTLRINIVDVNDNQPTFPPHSLVQVSEGAEVGTIITTITANDVDTNPAITYNFAAGGNPLNMFTIDKFSGKITLAAPLDHEGQSHYTIEVEASDTAHIARTKITVEVLDENDNPPIFSQQAYQVALPELSPSDTSVLQVSTTDRDKGINAEVIYSLAVGTEHGFYIHRSTGVVYSNTSHHYNPRQPVLQLVVTARDRGTPSMTSVAAITVQITDANNNPPKFSSETYLASIREDASRGHAVTRVSASDMDESRINRNIVYSIVSGNVNNTFQIASFTGEIIVLKDLDREKQSKYELVTLATDRGSPSKNTTSKVVIQVLDVNDHIPVFNESSYYVNVSEALDPGAVILQVVAIDRDEGNNARITYDITSGNDLQIFALDSESGVITLRESLDYDTVPEHRLIIRATDGQRHNSLSALTTVYIGLKDENDNAPQFPSPTYYEFVLENSPIGTTVFTAKANDADRGQFGVLNYSIPSGEDKDKFSIDATSGVVTTEIVFDFEKRQEYKFVIRAFDAGGKFTSVNVNVKVASADEYAPTFTDSNYSFSIPVAVSQGEVIGRVEATDQDEGTDGQVFYSLKNPSKMFKLNRTTGEIIVKIPPGREQGIRLDLVASSGKRDSKKGFATADISIGGHNGSLITDYPYSGENVSEGGIPSWLIVLIIALVFLVIILSLGIVYYYRKYRIDKKPVMPDQFDTSFDTIDIRHQPPASAPDLSPYPTSYNDLPYNHHGDRSHHGNTTSEMSEQSQSASSGRGSADDNEDVEDEEIRMINEGPLIKEQKLRERLGLPSDSGIRDDDNMSDVSVHNTQEYLARLGIDTTKTESTKGSQDLTHSIGSMHMFDEEGGAETGGVDINNLIYSKLNDVPSEEDGSLMDGGRTFGFGGDESQPSMTGSLSSIVHSEEELQGSYNWDYLLDWGPQYQPLAHVFSEIARLKDDSAPNYSREPQKKTLNPQVKTIPPPLLTSVAPRSIAPVALSTIRAQMAMPSLPRSPISHEASFTSPAMSPSFSPSLSPLATRSPSISPLMTPGNRGPAPGLAAQSSATSTPHHSRNLVQRQGTSGILTGASSGSETELRI